MESTMQDALVVTNEAKASRKRIKPKLLKDNALAAGLAAFEALEHDENATLPIQITAWTLVVRGIESIMRSRSKGVPLIRIYNDAKKAAGLRIGYGTFAAYVCEAAKAAGIKLEKSGSQTRHQPDAGSAAVPVKAPSGTADSQPDGYCDRCMTESVRTEKEDGRAWWRCPACKTFWADLNGQITNKRLNAKQGV